MRRLVPVIVVAILAGGIVWFFGLGILPAVVVILVIGAVGTVLRLVTPELPNRDWPLPPPPITDGARREAFELSWAMRTRSGIVDDRIVLRVRSIAANRLAFRHLDLDNPAHRRSIERLVGPQVYRLLTFGDGQRVRVTTILATLEILDSFGTSRGSTIAPNPNSEKQA
jgi:hypothetical protein